MGSSGRAVASACEWLLLLSSLVLGSFWDANPVAAQQGFISIDCGAGRAANRTSDEGIEWVSDGLYIVDGERSGSLGTPNNGSWAAELRDFAYFSKARSKFCYELPVMTNRTYLLRASFLWGNFTPLDGTILFDVTVMSTLWTTVNITRLADPLQLVDAVTVPLTREILLRSSGPQMDVCLVRRLGSPFINSLELRLLPDDLYSDVLLTRSDALVGQWRWSAAQCCSSVRYPEDSYDRIWYPYKDVLRWGNAGVTERVVIENLSSSVVEVENGTELAPMGLDNRPPVEVMKDAWIGLNGSLRMRFPVDGDSREYYLALYFQELGGTVSRNISVLLNGEGVASVTTSVNGTGLIRVNGITGMWANISLTAAGVGRNPILNAAEMYKVVAVNISSTDTGDVRSLDVIMARLGMVEWAGDPCFPVPWEWLACSDSEPSRVTQVKLVNFSLAGSIPLAFADLTELTDLWLDHNNFSGNVPNFSQLQKLKTLHLQNNQLSGLIPTTLGELQNLQELFLDNNKLTGPVPSRLIERLNASGGSFNFTVTGNSVCFPGNTTCQPVPTKPPPPPPPQSSDKDQETPTWAIGVIAGAAIVIVAIIVASIVIWFLYQKLKAKKMVAHAREVVSSRSAVWGQSSQAYTYEEVQLMTSNFTQVLGAGSFGEVFYGKLPDGQEVAVKVHSANSRQGTAEFANEVSLLSRVHHKYLVSLLGYCQESSDHQILIYTYMAKGSLGDHLYGKDAQNALSWRKRLDIALNAAQGLEYLHTFCSPPIIHRDVKPNNILLDENMVAKIADFGMSKSEFLGSQSGVSTAVKGTMGYLDPEYFSGWHRLNVKSDVYSFGVVLLELISGQKPTTVKVVSDGRELPLVDRARLVAVNEDLTTLVDPSLGNDYTVEAMLRVLELGLGGVQPQGIDRPDMNQMVQGLMEAIQIEKAAARGQGGKPRTVTFDANYADSTKAPLRKHSTDSTATWDSELSSAFDPRT